MADTPTEAMDEATQVVDQVAAMVGWEKCQVLHPKGHVDVKFKGSMEHL